jgi:DNA end-binding protein Ku
MRRRRKCGIVFEAAQTEAARQTHEETAWRQYSHQRVLMINTGACADKQRRYRKYGYDDSKSIHGFNHTKSKVNMGARAIWAGEIKIGSTSVPVKLYSAAQDKSIHFHILDAKKKTRVKQHMVNAESGEEIESKKIQKAYEVEPGTFVVLNEDELSSLEPKASRDIEITRFVPAGQISHLWYERPYFLGPDGNNEAYFALAEALRNQKKEGVARWVMRKKAYVGALRPNDDYLALITLRHADEVLSARDLPAPHARGLTAKELKMAEQLVGALEGEFNPEDFRDEYRDRVLGFIEAKSKGRKVKLSAPREKRPSASLADELSKSLKALKGEKERKVA